jgi:D-alanyl-D-alanine carboxypeptidase (penicillin-binding protein 5/6)
MAKLAAHIIHDDAEYYHYFGERDFTWNKIRQLNRNPLLTANLGVDGLKTGDTIDSGFGLVASAEANGRRIIAVINGLKSATERADEARKLVAFGLNDFEETPLFKPGDVVGGADVYGGAQSSTPLVAENAIVAETPRGSTDRLKAAIVYQGPLAAPVAEGAEVARLKIWRGDLLIVDAPLKTETAVAEGNLRQRALNATWQLAGDLLRKAIPRWQ